MARVVAVCGSKKKGTKKEVVKAGDAIRVLESEK